MSIRFNAVADLVTVSANLPTVSSCTLMGWFRHEAISTAANAMLCFNGTATYELQVKSATAQLALWNGTAELQGTTLTTSQWSNWQHYAFTCSGTGVGQLLAYLNGKLDITHDGNSLADGVIISMGNTSPGTDFMTGLACGIKIYKRALTAGEVKQEMRQLAPVNSAGLHSFYLFQDLATMLKDGGPYRNNATLGGTLEASSSQPPVPMVAYGTKAVVAKILTPQVYLYPQPAKMGFRNNRGLMDSGGIGGWS